MRAAILLVLLVGPGCAETASAPIVAVEPLGTTTPIAVAATTPAGKPKSDRCTAKLTAGHIRAKASCFLDEQISHGAGRLLYPCSGNGPADATFGEHVYTGSMMGGVMTLTMSSELDYTDGCHWTSQQRITGNPAERELGWSYRESATGPNACLEPCTATADLTIREPDDD